MDIRVALGPIVAMFIQGIKHITRDGKVGDGRLVAEHEFAGCQMLVEDAGGRIEPALQERQYVRIGRLRREGLQEAIRGEIAGELVIVE